MAACPGKWLKFFKAVHDTHRQKILDLLQKNGRMSVSEIVKKIKLSQPAVSHHLKILSDAGVIVSKKEGKEVYYDLLHDVIEDCCGGFMDHFKRKKKKN